MTTLIISLLLAAVPVGGSFGDAEATTVSLGETSMVIDLTVEVPEDTQAVIVHMGLAGENMSFPMLATETAGLWRLRTEVDRKNWQVVFEMLGPVSEVSQPMTLGYLGAQLEPEPGPTTSVTAPEDDLSGETQRWGYLALALAAASLSALAFWVLGAKDKDPENGDEEE